MLHRTIRLLASTVAAFWCANIALAEPLDMPALRTSLDRLLDTHSTARRTTAQLKVIDLQSGDVLYDRAGDRLLTPASNLKIYTSACALDTFGPEHQFPTRLGTTGPTKDGVLQGDLVFVGGGDSMLSSQELAELARRVKNELGIRRITGQVIVDNSRYHPQLKGPGWMWDDEPDYYNMSITPLMIDFNVLKVRLSPKTDGSVSAMIVPASSYPPVRLMPRSSWSASTRVTRQPFKDEFLVRDGPIDKPVDARLTMNDPTSWAQAVLVQMLVDQGIEITSTDHKSGTAPEITHAELVHEGTTLAETLKHFNNVSENAVGEVLLHEIAIAHGVAQPNWPDGAKWLTDWLIDSAGLEAGSFRLVDGSGLSRYNLISADSSVRLLQFMQQHKHSCVFFDSLPVYEINLKGLKWPTEQAKGFDPKRVFAKPGGMTGVSTISGYVDTLDGRRLAFSLLANGFVGRNAPVLDLRRKVWRTLVQYRR